MNRTLKYIFLALGGILAFVGLWTCIIGGFIFYVFWSALPDDGTYLSHRPAAYVGEACKDCEIWNRIPLPEQTDPELPMALEAHGIDHNYYFILRAPAEWQETFCKFYSYPTDMSLEYTLDEVRRIAGEVEDKRILNFLNAHEWHHFHSSHLIPGRQQFIDAWRDTSGEYVLLHVYDF